MNVLILLILGWASDYETKKGIVESKASRADQMRDYNASFAKMQEQLREYTDNLARGEQFLQRQILLFANAALGTTVARSAIKSMDKADEWREKLEKRYGTGDISGRKTQDAADMLLHKLNEIIGHRDRGSGQAASGAMGRGGHAPGGMVLGVGSGKISTAPPGLNRHGGGRAKPPVDDGTNARSLGMAAPTSQAIVGTNMNGALVKTSACSTCGKVGHEPNECPVAFAEQFRGRSMPGWNDDGSKNSQMWEGDCINGNCLQQWQAMQKLGFFTQTTRGAQAAFRLV
jgi:hypothetical protein